MDFLVAPLTLLVLVVLASWAANTFFKARISKELMEHATPYMKEGEGPALLVLGDSTGVGVGADRPEESVAGRLAGWMQAGSVENYASSGAMVEDLPAQVLQAKRDRYDAILVQIGGNDILAFRNAHESANRLSVVLGTLPRAERVIVMSAGNIGGATLFPPPLRPLHTLHNRAFHREFARVAHGWHALYVDLYDPFWKDPFLRDPQRYLARDGLHPSSYGYGLWFEKLEAKLAETS